MNSVICIRCGALLNNVRLGLCAHCLAMPGVEDRRRQFLGLPSAAEENRQKMQEERRKIGQRIRGREGCNG
jgi:hypothetical protein